MYSTAFRKYVELQVELRRLVTTGKDGSDEADVVADALDYLSIRLTSLEKSLVCGLQTDLLQPLSWREPKRWNGKPVEPALSPEEWRSAVAEAATCGPEALLDVLRQSPPVVELQHQRQEARAAAWRLLNCQLAAAVFAERASLVRHLATP